MFFELPGNFDKKSSLDDLLRRDWDRSWIKVECGWVHNYFLP